MGGGCLKTLLGTTRDISALERLIRSKAMVAHFHASVDEVITVVEAEGIEADILRTEELTIATNTAQLARLHPEVTRLQRWGDSRSFIETA